MKNKDHLKDEINLYTKRFENKGYEYRTSNWDEKRILKALGKLGVFDFKGKYILDFGCGTGTYTPYLNKCFENVIGLDITPTNIKIARKFDKKSTYIIGDGFNLPFKDHSFDAVFVGQVLHHFMEIEKPLKEINRVLKKGGILFIIEPNAWNPIVNLKYRIRVLKRVLKKEKSSYEKHRALGYKYMKKELLKAGFKILRYGGINFTPTRERCIWKFIKLIESYLESSPLNIFGGSLLITAKKVRDYD